MQTQKFKSSFEDLFEQSSKTNSVKNRKNTTTNNRYAILSHRFTNSFIIPKSSAYERELKEILSGNKEFIEKYCKGLSELERHSIMKILKNPFLMVRSAGSLGVDLVALRSDVSFPIEVKSSSEKTFRFSRNEKVALQLEEFMQKCSLVGVLPIYAFYLKNFRGDSWRIFTVPIFENIEQNSNEKSMEEKISQIEKITNKKIRGYIVLLYERLPKLEKTKEGNFIMRWENGMELSRFIDYLC